MFGPPYSLLVVDKPDASNAFSYGFGPDGGGGIVVYSGFLDDILSKTPLPPTTDPSPDQSSWWSSLLGSLFPLSPPTPRHPTPTPEQTADLAILLAHELSHLILSHHLETISSGTVIVPGALSLAADVIRTLLFPLTMLFGPFVNDAVAQLGMVGSGELIKIGEYCTNMKQEIEADIVSARLLAHAGFDARQAVKFWENRQVMEEPPKRASTASDAYPAGAKKLANRIMGSSHPVITVRIEKLKEELARWEAEKHAVLNQMRSQLGAAV
jgi:Zn-dependent protease with chaperone function